MPKTAKNEGDRRVMLSIQQRYLTATGADGFEDINAWIAYLVEAVAKKDAQYKAMQQAQDTLLEDFKAATGKEYNEWVDERAKAILEASAQPLIDPTTEAST